MNPVKRRYIVNPDILCEKEVDGMLLFDPHSGEVKILNETGAFVYETLRDGSDISTILQKMTEEFAIDDAAVAEADLGELLNLLEKCHLIHDLSEEASL